MSTTKRRSSTEREFLLAVKKQLIQYGWTELKVNAIARTAGFDKSLIYRYFGNLEELISKYMDDSGYTHEKLSKLKIDFSKLKDLSNEQLAAKIILQRVNFLIEHPDLIELIKRSRHIKDELSKIISDKLKLSGVDFLNPFANSQHEKLRQSGILLASGIFHLIENNNDDDESSSISLHGNDSLEKFEAFLVEYLNALSAL